jgi:hypothetical protein
MPEIKIKRGTDTARTDGTLGTPDQGEPIYSTSTKALFVGDGSTAGGVPATVPASLSNFIAVTSQDINALAADNLMEWDAATPAWGVDLTWSAVTDPHKVTINTAGVYEISATIAVDATASTPTRWNGIMRVFLNNTTNIGPEGKGGYIRESSGQDETSLHITPFAYTFAAADYIWLKVDRETSSATAAVDTTARACVLYIKRLT